MPEDKLTIETPEQIPLEFPLAGIGSRFLALAIDTLIQFVVAMSLTVISLLVGLATAIVGRQGSSGLWVVAVLVLVAFATQFGYFALFEAFWNGQTPGKRRVKLRVIKDSGQPITTYDAVARNLLRIVDGLPGFYGLGIVSVLLSSKNKRLGDYVAGTVVVHERPLEDRGQVSVQYAAAGTPSGYDASRLSAEEFQLIEAYLLRRSQLAPDVRLRLTRQIIDRISPNLQISSDDQRRPEPLLEKLAAEYRNLARFR